MVTKVKGSVLDSFYSVKDGGAVGDGSTDDTSALNNAVQTYSSVYWPSGTYVLTGTLAPGQSFHWIMEEGVKLQFNTNGSYTDMLTDNDADSGVDVCLDMKDCNDSVVTGKLFLITNASVPDMTIANAGNIPSTLCAIGASDNGSSGSGAESLFDQLNIEKFGYGLYQTEQNTGSGDILSFTRWRIGLLKIRFCLIPLKSGTSGNGFNDVWIDILRLSRNGGTSTIQGSDLNVGSFFNFGLSETGDVESYTYTSTATSNSLTMNTAMDGILANGDILVLGAGGGTWPDTNAGGDDLYFVGRVNTVSGTTVTLYSDVPTTVSAGTIHINPPSISLNTGTLNCQHYYAEGLHYHGITMSRNSSFVANIVKVSAGEYSSRENCAVWMNGVNGLVDFNIKGSIDVSAKVKSWVGLSMVKDTSSGNNAARKVRIGTSDKLATLEAWALAARWVEPVIGDYFPGTDTIVTTGDMDDNVTIDAAEALHFYTPNETGGSAGFLDYGDHQNSEVTIATGEITVVNSMLPMAYSVDTEADASSDDLDTINGGSIQGQMLILRAANSARTVVVKDGTGNLLLAGDFSLDSNNDTITLIYFGSSWREIARSNNA